MNKINKNPDVEIFEKFHKLLTAQIKEPWYFKCEKNNKNPQKGVSWKKQRLTFEQSKDWMLRGGNIGIAATDKDKLFLMDIDDYNEREQLPVNTLLVCSRKRCGFHAYVIGDFAKENIPTEQGELRSNWQYVLAPGSYVETNFNTIDEQDIPAGLKEKIKKDPLLGYYSIEVEKIPRKIEYDEIPRLYKEQKEKIRYEQDQRENPEPKKNNENKSAFWDLKISDVVRIPENRHAPHPLHGSDTGKNFSINGGLAHCWRHNVSLNALQYLAVESGIMSCIDAGTGHSNSGAGGSLLTKDKEKYLQIWEYAKKEGYISKDDPCPYGTKKEIINKNISETDFSVEITQELAKGNKRQASEKIAIAFQNKYKTYSIRDDKQSEMFVYQKGIYKPNGKTFIKEFCRLSAGFDFTTQLINEIILKIEADTYIEAEEFYNLEPKKEIAVLNGVLNVETRELSPFTSEKVFFNKIPVFFDNTKQPVKILQFFKEIFENEQDIQMLQELFGYLLYKNYEIEKAFMFLGKGRNGKGQLLELMKCLVGNDNVSAVSLQRLCDETSFNVCELHKKLLNVGGDISDGFLETTGMFKQLTGNDVISSQRKFMTDLKFKNYAKLIFSCNKLPKSKDNSRGFWDRWILLKFPYRFEYAEIIDKLPDEEKKMCKPRKNDIVSEIMNPKELSGLLNWALDGLNNLLKQEHFTFTPATQDVKDRWIKEADSFAAFCDEWIQEDYDSMISKEELRNAYNQFCKINQVEGVTDKHIKYYLTTEKRAVEKRYRDEKKDLRVWKNISFVQGVQSDHGFSTYSKLLSFHIGVKQKDSLDCLDKNTKKDIENPTSMEKLVNFVRSKKVCDILDLYDKYGRDLISQAKKEGLIYQSSNSEVRCL